MIARKTWREVRWMALMYFVILELLLFSAILYWPTLEKEIHRSALDSLIPADFMKRMLGGMREVGYPAYIATQQFFKGVNIVGISCAVLIGTGAIAGERETGTLELLLSRPVSRARILWSKFWVLALCVVVPIFLSSLTIPILTLCIDHESVSRTLETNHLLHGSWHGSLFCLMFLAATLFLSSYIKAQVQVAFTIGAVIILEVGLYFVQELRTSSLFVLSDFDQYAPMMVGNANFWRVFWANEVWMLLVTAGLYGLTLWRFRRMDL